MTKKQKIRWGLAAASRLNAAGAARTADLMLVGHSYLMSANVAGFMRAYGFGYSGGDYWN